MSRPYPSRFHQGILCLCEEMEITPSPWLPRQTPPREARATARLVEVCWCVYTRLLWPAQFALCFVRQVLSQQSRSTHQMLAIMNSLQVSIGKYNTLTESVWALLNFKRNWRRKSSWLKGNACHTCYCAFRPSLRGSPPVSFVSPSLILLSQAGCCYCSFLQGFLPWQP